MEDDERTHMTPAKLEALQSVWLAPVKNYSIFLTFVNDAKHRSHLAFPLSLYLG